jgi:hypothetical protein
VAAPDEHTPASRNRLGDDLGQQATLADARLTDHRDDVAMPVPGPVQSLPQPVDLRLAPDERQFARQSLISQGRRFGPHRMRRRRALHVHRRKGWALPEDLLIELLGRRLRLHAELSL